MGGRLFRGGAGCVTGRGAAVEAAGPEPGAGCLTGAGAAVEVAGPDTEPRSKCPT